MDQNIPVAVVVEQLKQEIAERQALVSKIESIASKLAPAPASSPALPPPPSGRPWSIAEATIEILKNNNGKPMHGRSEIIPALELRGIKVKHPGSLATVLLRNKFIKRTAPGTFGLTTSTVH